MLVIGELDDTFLQFIRIARSLFVKQFDFVENELFFNMIEAFRKIIENIKMGKNTLSILLCLSSILRLFLRV